MKYALITFFCLASTLVIAQKLPDGGVNRIRISDNDKSILAELQTADDWVSVDPHKTYYWYSSNAVHTTQGGYSGKLLNGSYTEYYLNKNLREQGTFKNGLKTGVWKSWNDQGGLLSFMTWQDGTKSGKFELLDDKGMVKTSGTYRSNLLDGIVKSYVSADSATVVKYKNGKVIAKSSGESFWRKVNVFKRRKAKATAKS